MSNRLTPALLAAAITAVINVSTANMAVSWNMFLAAAVAMLFGFDLADSKVADGSPAGHSLASAFISIYFSGMGAYLAISLGCCGENAAVLAMAALGAGALSHVLADLLKGRTVFTFPRNLEPGTWLREAGPDSDRFWPGWGRASLARHLEDVHLNIISAGLILACIWLGQGNAI